MTREHQPPATSGRQYRAVPAGPHHRAWWKWLLLGLLLAFSLAVTILYAAALTTDLSAHHWTAALVASRDAVPAVVGWAALLMVFLASRTKAERLLSADHHAISARRKQAARDRASVQAAARRVHQLTAGLDELMLRREQSERAGSAGRAHLDRAIADATARLDQARQWLTGAEAALGASAQAVTTAQDKLTADFPDPAPKRNPAAGKPA